MENIILIGMPGCGKSTVGVVLAKALGMDFIDSDLLIQRREGKRLARIIEEMGDDGFRAVENEVKNIRIIIAGRASGQSAEKIIERIRESYV